jgi:glycosyltransferase involved in cell wall biosynthesis
MNRTPHMPDALPPSAAGPVEISIVVCTRDRAEQLRACLEHLARLEFDGGWELVVVDNGSTDATPMVVAELASRAPFPVVSLREERGGQSNARNTGPLRARGGIVAFTDDDCYPDAGYLVALREAFRDPGVGWVGGRVLLHDPTDASVTVRTETEAELFPARSFLRPGSVHGANMAFRAGLAEAVGGFDPYLGPGTPLHCADDTDFLARLSYAGFAGRYVPELVVRHHHRRKPGSAELRRLRRGHALGRGAYYLKSLGRPGTRRVYARMWLESLRRGSRREAQGAALYLWARLRGSLLPHLRRFRRSFLLLP